MTDHPPARPHSPLSRLVTLLVLLSLFPAALYALFYTDFGSLLRTDREAAGRAFHDWVDGHHVVAPLILIALYVAGGLSLLPVWWIQILAGYGFGMWLGVTYSLAGATAAAIASYLAARLLLADWVHDKFEAKHAKLRELDEKMGHNGLMIVMASRLMHFIPFGVSNYLFGVTRITPMDVVLGTLLGNAPMITLYVAIGAGRHPYRDWRFMTALTIVNILLLVPVALRYWKPQWFRKIGVE
jgi:phospholipase D1/2